MDCRRRNEKVFSKYILRRQALLISDQLRCCRCGTVRIYRKLFQHPTISKWHFLSNTIFICSDEKWYKIWVASDCGRQCCWGSKKKEEKAFGIKHARRMRWVLCVRRSFPCTIAYLFNLCAIWYFAGRRSTCASSNVANDGWNVCYNAVEPTVDKPKAAWAARNATKMRE